MNLALSRRVYPGDTFHHSYFLTSAVGGSRSAVVTETALFMPGDVRLLPVCTPHGHCSLIAWKQAKYENMKRGWAPCTQLEKQQQILCIDPLFSSSQGSSGGRAHFGWVVVVLPPLWHCYCRNSFPFASVDSFSFMEADWCLLQLLSVSVRQPSALFWRLRSVRPCRRGWHIFTHFAHAPAASILLSFQGESSKWSPRALQGG